MARRTPAEPEAVTQVQGRCQPREGIHSRGIFFKKAGSEWNSIRCPSLAARAFTLQWPALLGKPLVWSNPSHLDIPEAR